MSAGDLRAAAKRSADARQASRILAIAMVLDGFSREEAARLCGMDRQTLRDWVHRYNEAGLEGLADRARSGRPASLSWVEQGSPAAQRDPTSARPSPWPCSSCPGPFSQGRAHRQLLDSWVARVLRFVLK